MRIRIVEDKEAVKKNFPSISEEDFERIIQLDPTYKSGSNSVGKYGKWLLTLFTKGKLDNEGHVKDLINRFEENKKYLKNKDINSFKSLEAVDDYLNDNSNYNEKSHRQLTRDNQKARRNAEVSQDLVTTLDGFDIYVPTTYANSCKLGQGTRWCTASTESDYYYNYYKDKYGGNYYILINSSEPGEKYQFHFQSHQFMDKYDHEIYITEFLDEHPGINKFFRPIIKKAIEDDFRCGDLEDNSTCYDLWDVAKALDEFAIHKTISGEDFYNIYVDTSNIIDYNFVDLNMALDAIGTYSPNTVQYLNELGVFKGYEEAEINSLSTSEISELIYDYCDNGGGYSVEIESIFRNAYLEAYVAEVIGYLQDTILEQIRQYYPDCTIKGETMCIGDISEELYISAYLNDNYSEVGNIDDLLLQDFVNTVGLEPIDWDWYQVSEEEIMYNIEVGLSELF